MEIGNRIQELRKKKNISQEELANVMNVSRQAVSKWESNLSAPDIEKIIDLCEYFDVSADYLLRGKEISKKPVGRWVEFYPIVSLAIKLIFIIVFYFINIYIVGLPWIFIYVAFAILVYLFEKKFMEIYLISNKNIYHELGVVFYSFPFIHTFRYYPYYYFYRFLEWAQEFALTLHRRNLHKNAFAIAYRSIKGFQEYIRNTLYFRNFLAIIFFIIINIFIIQYIRKRNLNQK